jgi:hypothetical protein
MDEILQLDMSRPFPATIPMDPNTKALASVPGALYFPAVLGLAAAAGLAGSALGRAAAPLEQEQKDIVAVVVGAAAAGAVVYGGVQVRRAPLRCVETTHAEWLVQTTADDRRQPA